MTGIRLFCLSTDIMPFESTEMSCRPAPPAPVLEQPSDPMNVWPWLPKTELVIVAWRWKGATAVCVFLIASVLQSTVYAMLVFEPRKWPFLFGPGRPTSRSPGRRCHCPGS